MPDDRCKGCREVTILTRDELERGRCKFDQNCAIHLCPCLDCLVKVVCEDPCQDFSESWDKLL